MSQQTGGQHRHSARQCGIAEKGKKAKRSNFRQHQWNGKSVYDLGQIHNGPSSTEFNLHMIDMEAPL